MNKLLSILLITIVAVVGVAVFSPATARAACQTEDANFLSFPTWYKYLDDRNGDCAFAYSKNDYGSIGKYITRILMAIFEILARVAGMVAVVFVIYGGFTYMTSQGQPDKVNAGKTTILNSLIGMVIAVLAVAIVNLVAGSLVP